MGLMFHLAERFLRAAVPPLRARLRPLKLTLACTYRCNHRCQTCGIWALYRDNPGAAKGEMAFEDYERLFRELREDILFIDWTGGEPFLREDSAEVFRCAAATCPKLSSIVIATNGLLTDRIVPTVSKVAAELPGLRFSVNVSLDGEEELHDGIRGIRGAFRAATRTLRDLQEAATRQPNIEVKASYTISRYNAGRFAAFQANILPALGMDIGDVAFNLEHSGHLYQRPADAAAGPVAVEDFQKATAQDVRHVIEAFGRRKPDLRERLTGGYRRYFIERAPTYLADAKRLLFRCQATRNSIFVDPFGTIFPCIIWDHPLGNVRDGVAQALRTETTARARKAIRKAHCPVCWNACEVIASMLSPCALTSVLAKSALNLPFDRSTPT